MKKSLVLVFGLLFAFLSGFAIAAAPTYTISGVVETSDGIVVEGVSVFADNEGGSFLTGTNGSYSIVVAKRWSGTISVGKA